MKAVLVGLGRMGMRHGRVLRDCGLNITGICDTNPAATSEVGSALGVDSSLQYTNPGVMLEEQRPELMVVATTAPAHAKIVEMGVRAGVKAILCEKPMAPSLAECDEMIEVCRSARVKLAINHQMRFMPQYTAPKEIGSSEALGGITSVQVSAGNFGLAMNGTHYFEMFRFIADELPTRVSAYLSEDRVPNPRGTAFEDVGGQVLLSTRSGKRFFMDCSTDQGHGMHVVYMCRHGRISVDELAGRMYVVHRKPEYRDLPTTRYGMPYESFEQAIEPADAIQPTRAVLDSLLNDSGYPSGEDGRAAMECLVGAHLSSKQGGIAIDLNGKDNLRNLVLPIA